ncbi:hypothetical protein ACFQS4_03200 [Saliphagus sp. GCM10025317]
MDKETLPEWAWLFLGLMVAAAAANLASVVLQISTDWRMAIIVTAMAPVLVYVGVWYDPDRQYYWEQSRAKIFGDVGFLVVGTAVGAGIAIALTIDLIGSQFLRDLVAMLVGFLTGWALFWWRNPNLYRPDNDVSSR